MTSIGTKLRQKYPSAPIGPACPWRLVASGNGVEIAKWDEAVLGPPMTVEEIETWEPPAERRKVRKDLVEQRLAAIGKLDACMAIIMGNAAFFTRWYARAYPWVYADDSDTIAVIEAVQADPETILAAE